MVDRVVDGLGDVDVECDAAPSDDLEWKHAASEARANASDPVARPCRGRPGDSGAVPVDGGRAGSSFDEVVPGQERVLEVGMGRIDAGVDDCDDDVG